MQNEGQVSDSFEPMSASAQSGQGTAKRAAEILVNAHRGASGEKFVVPTATQRQTLLVEFAKTGAVIYGKAFDVVKLEKNVNLDDPKDIERNMQDIVLCEVKSTKTDADEGFRGHFFSISTAELLVAQSLGDRFGFVFVSTASGRHREFSLKEVLERVRKIYPTWSIQF